MHSSQISYPGAKATSSVTAAGRSWATRKIEASKIEEATQRHVQRSMPRPVVWKYDTVVLVLSVNSLSSEPRYYLAEEQDCSA